MRKNVSPAPYFMKNLLLDVKCFPLEQDHIDRRHADIGVGKVEYRAKEIVVVIHQKVQPARHAIPLEQWEVEHIHHLAHQERTVTLAKCCHCEWG